MDLYRKVLAMLRMIPLEDGGDLRLALEDIQSSLEFAAPEMQGFWAGQIAETLQYYLGDDDLVGWKLDVLKIWNPNYFLEPVNWSTEGF